MTPAVQPDPDGIVTKSRPAVLIVAGSDSSGGAGIQADIITVNAMGCHPLTAITAITAQDNHQVTAVYPLPSKQVRAQMETALRGYPVAAIKTGMLHNRETIALLVEICAAHPHIPLIIDPVLCSSSGKPLLDADAIAPLRAELFSLARLVTPNIPEAELLTDIACNNDDARELAARSILAFGAKAVLLKGGHSEGDILTDTYIDSVLSGDSPHYFSSPRIITSKPPRGTGCRLASAIACGLARGVSLEEAIRDGRDYVQTYLRAL